MNDIVGMKIEKISRKPFKSGEKQDTISSVCSSLLDPKRRIAYVLSDGVTIVSAYQCIVI